MLSDQKITKHQRSKAIKGLEAIYKHGILHNDIWEENILINDKGALYLIDFGMASQEDTKKKRKLFEYNERRDAENAKLRTRIKKMESEFHKSGTEADSA